VHVPHRVIVLGWPFLIAVTVLAVAFLSRGQLTRTQGAILLTAYAGYIAAWVLIEQ
jgi:Ca2+/Na+ antiporter